jgi:histone H3/H4
MKIEQSTQATVADLWARVESTVEGVARLEEAAQTVARALHTHHEESVVLARLFVTVPFSRLPGENREWVRNLAEAAGAGGELRESTPILSLIGTHGEESAWCDRRRSRGHVGIPLISASFIEAVPMISRLLKELGVPVEWVDRHDSEMVINAIGNAAGLFFVDSATDAVDHAGRKIITAQDFVAERAIKSVFGVGGAYSSGQILVIICFCRDGFTREIAQRFLPLVSLFISKTTDLADPSRVFVPRALV